MQVHDGFSTLTQISRSRLPANKAKTGCCPFRRSRLQSDHAEQSDTGICRLSWTERTGVHIFLYDVPKQTFFQSPTTSNRKPRITVLYGLLGFVLRLLSNDTGDVAMIFRYRQHLSILYLHFQQLRSYGKSSGKGKEGFVFLQRVPYPLPVPRSRFYIQRW